MTTSLSSLALEVIDMCFEAGVDPDDLIDEIDRIPQEPRLMRTGCPMCGRGVTAFKESGELTLVPGLLITWKQIEDWRQS